MKGLLLDANGYPNDRLVAARGWLVVLVDSLVALGLELLAAGKHDEALERLNTRLGCWVVEGVSCGRERT